MPAQPVDNSYPQSRTAEFSSGATGLTGQGSTHSVQQMAPTSYSPSSVLSPLASNPNGMSSTTYSQNRALNYYRSY
jgi:hypothetical protein